MVNLFGVEPLSGAYGRDYTSIKAAQADFDAGKDFRTAGGSYVGKSELANDGVTQIDIRYAKNQKKGVLKVGDAKDS